MFHDVESKQSDPLVGNCALGACRGGLVVVYGSGNADGNRHTHSNLPILLAGKGDGSLSSGRRVNYNGKPLTNLYLTLGERMGVDALDSFGDSTGPLKDV